MLSTSIVKFRTRVVAQAAAALRHLKPNTSLYLQSHPPIPYEQDTIHTDENVFTSFQGLL